HQPAQHPITVALGPNSELTKRMLDLAARLIESREQRLLVLAAGDELDAPQLRARLAGIKVQIAMETGFASFRELLAASRWHHRGLLILDAATADKAGALQETVEKFGGDLLLAR